MKYFLKNGTDKGALVPENDGNVDQQQQCVERQAQDYVVGVMN